MVINLIAGPLTGQIVAVDGIIIIPLKHVEQLPPQSRYGKRTVGVLVIRLPEHLVLSQIIKRLLPAAVFKHAVHPNRQRPGGQRDSGVVHNRQRG